MLYKLSQEITIYSVLINVLTIGKIEKELFNGYVKKFRTDKGILLKRVLYGIVAVK